MRYRLFPVTIVVSWLLVGCAVQRSALPTIQELVARVDNRFNEMEAIDFQADILHRYTDSAGEWKGHHYDATMSWARHGPSRTEVRDLEQAGKVIAVYVNGEPDKEEAEAEGCLFGSLQQAWFEDESSFFHRGVLQDSRVERVNVLNGRVCYVIARDIIDFGEYRGRRQWGKLTKFVDADSYLPHAWRSEFRLGEDWENSEVWRVVERLYHYKKMQDRDKSTSEETTINAGVGSESSDADSGGG